LGRIQFVFSAKTNCFFGKYNLYSAQIQTENSIDRSVAKALCQGNAAFAEGQLLGKQKCRRPGKKEKSRANACESRFFSVTLHSIS